MILAENSRLLMGKEWKKSKTSILRSIKTNMGNLTSKTKEENDKPYLMTIMAITPLIPKGIKSI